MHRSQQLIVSCIVSYKRDFQWRHLVFPLADWLRQVILQRLLMEAKRDFNSYKSKWLLHSMKSINFSDTQSRIVKLASTQKKLRSLDGDLKDALFWLGLQYGAFYFRRKIKRTGHDMATERLASMATYNFKRSFTYSRRNYIAKTRSCYEFIYYSLS